MDSIYRQKPAARSLELVVSRSYVASVGLGALGVALLLVLAWGFVAKPVVSSELDDPRCVQPPDIDIGCTIRQTVIEPGLRMSGLELPVLAVALVTLLGAAWMLDKTTLILDEGRDRLTLRRDHVFGADETVRELRALSDATLVRSEQGIVARLAFTSGEPLDLGPPSRREQHATGIVGAIHRFVPARSWASRDPT